MTALEHDLRAAYSMFFMPEIVLCGSAEAGDCCFTAEPIRMFVNSLGVAQTIIQHLTLELDVFQRAL